MTEADPARDSEIDAFWAQACRRAKLSTMPGYFGPGALESLRPPAWSFGATSRQADELLALVLDGTKTATASAAWDYEAGGDELPAVGTLGIVLDGAGHPRALLATTSVEVVPFDEVSEEHARLEGEGDLSLAHWREVHRRFFTAHAEHEHGFVESMPVVLERFEVLYQS
ncbi:MAG: ASCH domain-containing protein [Nocardioides sp.]|uniref:ASCH domain-containing protein n=1 Tax=Nocardioides sp. TaxID=35761 RepID=UPI0039E70FB3